jgi:hypothetical protein
LRPGAVSKVRFHFFSPDTPALDDFDGTDTAAATVLVATAASLVV